jgi:hypothetical protein
VQSSCSQVSSILGNKPIINWFLSCLFIHFFSLNILFLCISKQYSAKNNRDLHTYKFGFSVSHSHLNFLGIAPLAVMDIYMKMHRHRYILMYLEKEIQSWQLVAFKTTNISCKSIRSNFP